MKGFKIPQRKGRNPHPHFHRPKMSSMGKSAFPASQTNAFNSPDTMAGAGPAFPSSAATPDVAGMPPEAGPVGAGAPPDAGAAPPAE